MTRADGRVSVRVFNPSDAPTEVAIEGRHGLAGRPARAAPSSRSRAASSLRPHGIATAVLDD